MLAIQYQQLSSQILTEQGYLVASSPGHSQVLSYSHGEKCKIKSGSDLGRG